MPASLTAFLDDVRVGVDARLAVVLAGAMEEAGRVAPDALPVLSAAGNLTLRGGKRLRPAFVYAAIACVTAASPPPATVDLGAALELLQSYLLTHDDWMDGDGMRRGAPSVHAALGAHYHDEHIGACTAVLAGDMLSCLVHEMVAGLDLPAACHRAVLAVFAQMEREVILGQCLDVTRCADVERIHQLKTGSYTIRGPLRLGHAIADGSVESLAALDAYAAPLGLAFQLRDDLLGVFGSEAQTGKPVGGDLREGKQTALLAHALTHLRGHDRNTLQSIVGHREATEADIERARELMEASGARDAAEARIAALRAACLDALATEALLLGGRDLLAGLAHTLTERER